MQNLPPALKRTLPVLLAAAAAVLLALHFVHLRADFPNNSGWMDWSKYTDEGWYGDAAIRHYTLGHWYVAGDFNPAAALPVWPLLEALVFRFTGVSLSAARALTVVVFALILLTSWLLVTRASRFGRRSLAAGVAVLLLAASPFCFVFTRIAILEPLLILLTLLALLAAQRPQFPRGATRLLPTIPLILALGLLLPLMVLTKTTALFLLPAVAWMLLASSGYRMRDLLRVGVPAAALGGLLWAVYFLVLVRPQYLADYRYLFTANAYTEMTRANFVAVLAGTLKDGRWMGTALYALALAAAAFALSRPRRLREHPLIPTLLLWIGGYLAFLAYHNNLQPRYYLVVAVPLTLLLPVVVEDLLLPGITRPDLRRAFGAIAALAVLCIVVHDTAEIVGFLRRPEYTLVNAAAGVKDYITRDREVDPRHNPLILSISGSDISLMTGLPSICDDFGTLELVERVRKYSPGWYVAWNQVEDDKMDSIWPLFRMVRVAAFPAMDDPDRNLLVLYRLEPNDGTPRPPRRKATRRRQPTGQQPRLEQLKH